MYICVYVHGRCRYGKQQPQIFAEALDKFSTGAFQVLQNPQGISALSALLLGAIRIHHTVFNMIQITLLIAPEITRDDPK